MPRTPIDMTGQVIGCFTVLGPSPKRAASRQAYWRCRCDCGRGHPQELDVLGKNLRNGRSLSCGQCTHTGSRKRVWRGDRERHDHAATPTYRSWKAMKERCTNPRHIAYPEYGGRGITIHEPWLAFEVFLADMGERPDGMTLDRMDHDGPYGPANCRWASVSKQNYNRRASRQLAFAKAFAPLAKKRGQ